MTSSPTPETGKRPDAGKAARELNDMIRYTMWSVFRLIGSVGDEDRGKQVTEVETLLTDLEAADVRVRGLYDVSGLRADADVMVWWHAETAEALQNQQPPIWFNEQDYRSGAKLLDYKLDEKSAMFGRQVRFEVQLTTEKNGRRSERTIAYLVDTTPNRVIAREGL